MSAQVRGVYPYLVAIGMAIASGCVYHLRQDDPFVVKLEWQAQPTDVPDAGILHWIFGAEKQPETEPRDSLYRDPCSDKGCRFMLPPTDPCHIPGPR